jgi:DDE superfamily endonuclease
VNDASARSSRAARRCVMDPEVTASSSNQQVNCDENHDDLAFPASETTSNSSATAAHVDDGCVLLCPSCTSSKVDVGCQTDLFIPVDNFCQTDTLISKEKAAQTTAISTEEMGTETEDEYFAKPVSLVSTMKDIGTETEDKFVAKPVSFIQIRTDDELKTWTGLGTLYFLEELTKLVADIESKRRIMFDMTARDRIIMTMVVLKHVMQYNMLSTLYNVSDRCISKYFNSTLLVLSEILHPLVYWPSPEENFHSMPLCFEKYTNTSIVLDCTESKCAKLSCLDCRIATYSFYKSGHTVKYLLGVTPAGTINYISRGYPGRASDKFIFNNEHCIDLLDEKDAVMTDKGFSIEKELAAKGEDSSIFLES